MKAPEIRQRFTAYFSRQGHTVLPSAGLVPEGDPSLLFTNSGMVPFKRVFLREEKLPFSRVTTVQKCLRVSGKHNDLEEVGVTARHQTFFEMLGNFSFGDYFKRDAIRFAWELLTEELDIPRDRLWVSVHYSDVEAVSLWQEIAGLSEERIFRLGDKDNFWQMGETGPCGPCSEIHYDLRLQGERSDRLSVEGFEAGSARGEFLEIWNLVFMQYDRSSDGKRTPLPAPSIDTGAGLERLASVLQGVDSNYKTDIFVPLIERAVEVVGIPYDPGVGGTAYRVLADHARAVAFLLADSVIPANEGIGYVLRRILRRAVRHAWLLGRRDPTLVHVIDAVVIEMGDAYPELVRRHEYLLQATREEEERFLSTIDRGIEIFDRIAPPLASPEYVTAETESDRVISGADTFRLYDTFGFPLDLSELIARERGYSVDVEGFEKALAKQRERSRADREDTDREIARENIVSGMVDLAGEEGQEWIGWETTEVDTDVIAFRREDARVALVLRRNPFYAEAGGQVSDHGVIEGQDWEVKVDDVRRVGERVIVFGDVHGSFVGGKKVSPVHAIVDSTSRRDTERNHTATHLLHAALQRILGTHVFQRGSLVEPDRLRFDFSHPRPLTAEEIRRVEEEVNTTVLADVQVHWDLLNYKEAIEKGAMALFGEKYGDVVRLVSIPGISMELCGGTHVRHTSEIGLFCIVSESGIAGGIRRIEAVTGRAAYMRTIWREEIIRASSKALKTTPDNLLRRIDQLVRENRGLQQQLDQARNHSGLDVVGPLIAQAEEIDGMRVVATMIQLDSADELRTLGDKLRSQLGSGVAVLAVNVRQKISLLAVVTDDLVAKGIGADRLVREIVSITGGSGGGRPHMAQGGGGDPDKLEAALARVPPLVGRLLAGGTR